MRDINSKLTVFVVLLGCCLCLSSGDFEPIPNSTVYSDSKITMNFYVDTTTNNITIYMKFKAYGYFNLEYSNKMSKVPIFVNLGRLQ